MNDEPIPLEDEIYEEEIEVEEESSVTMAMWGEITGDIDNQTDLKEALDAKQNNLTQAQLDAVNSGINSTKVETYDGYQAQINTKASQSALDAEAEARRQADSTLQGKIDAEETARKASDKDIQDVLDGETLARQNADTSLGSRIDTEIHDRQVADIALQGQIDAITSKSDVVDVVATYADLQAYDTQHLGDNDVIKVLDDETHGDALTYYRWSKTNQTWTFIGQEAPYYSKSQTDTLLLGKQNTIDSSHKLSADLVDDTSTTNKFVKASDITNWNGKQDALTAGTGIDITDGVISTPAIVPEVVTELPTTGAEGKLYLTPKAHTTSTATGNPIEATITAQAGQLESFQLDGDTFQKSYQGKNLCGIPDQTFTHLGVTVTIKDGEVTMNGTSTGSGTKRISPIKTTTLDGSYTTNLIYVSGTAGGGNFNLRKVSDNTVIQGTQTSFFNSNQNVSYSVTNEDIQFGIYILTTGTVFTNYKFKIQIVAGSTADYDFEPYVGGQPSPSTEYPQQIQTVTGLQTISINGTNYPLDLDSLELCKLGTYQDYIYKDGDSWKVHRETKRVTVDGSQRNGNITQYGFAQIRIDSEALYVSAPPVSYCSNLSSHDIYDSLPKTYAIRSSSTQCNLRLYFTPQLENFNAYLDWCAQNKPSVVAPLQQSAHTDTTITDQTLIAQLEAIRTALLQNGANTITNTAIGSNLAGDMEIGYYGFNPRNRYDKWLWLDINNNYEQIGGE